MLMLCDLIFNCISLFPRSRDGLLVIFIFQDLFLVLSITTLLMTFFSTYLFQAGLVEVLARKFRGAGIVCLLYCVLCVTLHAGWLLEKWSDPRAPAAPALTALFTAQRCCKSNSRNQSGAGIVCLLYCVLCVTLHAGWLLEKWSDPRAPAAPALTALFTAQRCLSPWYYFVYKRAALRVSDPRFYEDIDWIDRQLRAN
ncbi:hypothetical protein NE865_16037 [Phthorimaea operculella]|nr:hypothetical protein NE865_16037 [Phthorimaea operculella]